MLNDLPEAQSQCVNQDENLHLYRSNDCTHSFLITHRSPASCILTSQGPLPITVCTTDDQRAEHQQPADCGNGHMPSRLFLKKMSKDILKTGSLSEISLWPTKAPTRKEKYFKDIEALMC